MRGALSAICILTITFHAHVDHVGGQPANAFSSDSGILRALTGIAGYFEISIELTLNGVSSKFRTNSVSSSAKSVFVSVSASAFDQNLVGIGVSSVSASAFHRYWYRYWYRIATSSSSVSVPRQYSIGISWISVSVSHRYPYRCHISSGSASAWVPPSYLIVISMLSASVSSISGIGISIVDVDEMPAASWHDFQFIAHQSSLLISRVARWMDARSIC